MKKTDDSRRVSRVEKEIQQVIAEYLIKGFKEPLPGLVTISQVKMPADLRSAKVYVSILSDDQDRTKVIDLLQSYSGKIQRFIGDTLKMRYCPVLKFFEDKTTDQVLKIEKLLEEVAQEKKNRVSNNESSES